MNIRTFVAFVSQNLQYNFPKMRGGWGVKGHLELFRKNIRFGISNRPLAWSQISNEEPLETCNGAIRKPRFCFCPFLPTFWVSF